MKPVSVSDQVVARLVLKGVYPFFTSKGFLYFTEESGQIIGTKESKNFKSFFPYTIAYLGEAQLSEEQKDELKKYGLL